MEIKKGDVVKIVLQFLRENGYNRSFNVLSEESNTTLNLVDNVQDFRQICERLGKWDRVLQQVQNLRLPKAKLMDLYEVVICELLEINERETALLLLNQLIKGSDFHQTFEERYLRLDYIIRKPGDIDKLQLYQDVLTKENRRQQLANNIIAEISDKAPPSKLLQLIGNALRYEYGDSNLPQIDLLYGKVQQAIEQSDDKEKVITKISKIIKYTEATRIQSATFTPDGNHLITGSADGVIEVWDPLVGKVRSDLQYQAQEQFMMHTSPIYNLNASQDSTILASVDQSFIKVWKIQTGKLLAKIDNTHKKPLSCTLFTSNMMDLLSASTDIHTIDLQSLTIRKTFRGHTASVNSMLLSQQNSQLYSASDDSTVRVWDYGSCECVFSYRSSAASFQLMWGISDLKSILVGSRSRVLTLLSSAMNELKTYTLPKDILGEFVSCGISPHGGIVYGLTSSGFLVAFDHASGNMRKTTEHKVDHVCFHPLKNLAFGYSGKGELVFFKG